MFSGPKPVQYVWIPPGEVMMGCSPEHSSWCASHESPPHKVSITGGFWMGKTEVTQAAWERVKGGRPSYFKGDQLPVETVDWAQANDYCRTIGGRLPTEKEWEYAALGGVASPRYDHNSVNATAWQLGNSGWDTHPVGLKPPNAFGLYDMLGNVWEWTADDSTPGSKVVRGCSHSCTSENVRASYSGDEKVSNRDRNTGFRCVAEFR